MKILVVFYSAYGHVYEMAEAVAEGARQVDGAEVTLKKVPETLPRELTEKLGILEAQKKFDHIPVADPKELDQYDAIIFGTPTRFGNMSAQMRAFLDSTGGLWAKQSLVGKVGGVFTSSNTQHGGQESTILSFHITLLHHGMIIAGLPYSFKGQLGVDEIKGGSPYGASTVVGDSNENRPKMVELEGAKYQGRYIAEITRKLTGQGGSLNIKTYDL